MADQTQWDILKVVSLSKGVEGGEDVRFTLLEVLDARPGGGPDPGVVDTEAGDALRDKAVGQFLEHRGS